MLQQQERRQHGRKTLKPLAYINLPSDNGGIVLDVSEQGLRFWAVAPLEEPGPIHFWFSAHSNLIAGIADVVWLDQSKKTGGLQFTHLPDAAREQIRSWPDEQNVSSKITEDFTLEILVPEQSASTKDPVASATDALNTSPQFESSLSEPTSLTLARESLPALGEGLSQPYVASTENYFEEQKYDAFKAIGISFAVLAIALLFFAYHRGVGQGLVWLGTKISGQSNPQSVKQMPPPNLPSQIVAAADSSADKSKVQAAPVAQAPPPTIVAKPEPAKAHTAEVTAPPPAPVDTRLRNSTTPTQEVFLQVTAVMKKDYARTMADTLRREHFPVQVRTPTDDSYYRVLVGPFAGDESAQDILVKLKKAGFNPFIRHDLGTSHRQMSSNQKLD